MKVALVYDRVNKWGGAERVLLALHELFPDAPLYTSVYNPDTAPPAGGRGPAIGGGWAKVFSKVIPSFLQNFPFAKVRHELYAPLMPIAFESFDFSEYDIVISVTSEAAKGIITRPGTLHICYCLTPTRYLWSGYNDYFGSLKRRRLLKLIVSYLRKWDKIAGQRPDIMVAISKNVADRIKRYYGREAKVVYPPVEASNVSKVPKVPKGSYYLIVSRLVPYKKVDLVIKAFNKLKLPLVVVGTGSEEKGLRRMAQSNIRFVGYVGDEKLMDYYQGCKALIFPQEEDFGIVALEAQAAGKPVIAYRRGGALETVIEGKTGVFFDKQTSEALISAVKKFDPRDFKPEDCVKNARRFNKKTFFKEFATLVSTANS